MMELAALSGAAVATAAPYFAKMLDGATEKIGEDAADAAGKLVGWLRAKLTPGGKAALEELQKKPDNALKRNILDLQIQTLLAEQPELTGQLEALVKAVPAPAVVQNLTAGDGAKVAQLAGINNSFNIS